MRLIVSQPGDTVESAAKALGCSSRQLLYANELNHPAMLSPGLALISPQNRKSPAAAEMSACIPEQSSQQLMGPLLPGLSYVFPFSRRVLPGGEISPGRDSELLKAAESCGTEPIMCLSNLDDSGVYSPQLAHSLLSSEQSRQKLVAGIMAALDEKRAYRGVLINFCYLYGFDRDNYSAFIRLLSHTLHQSAYYLFVSLAPHSLCGQPGRLSAAYDFPELGHSADRILLLCYDWGYSGSPPMACGGLETLQAALEQCRSLIAPEKTLMCLSNYGYNWALPWRLGDSASPISHSSAVNLAIASQREVRHQAGSLGSSFSYTDSLGTGHIVWFDDVRSFQAKLRLARSMGLAGWCIWSMARVYRPYLLYTSEHFYRQMLI